MANKMTYVDALNIAIELINQCECSILDVETDGPKYDMVKEKLTALRDQTAKRNSATDRKPTKAQVQNAELSEVVREVLSNSANPMTITEIMRADERLSTLSNQKVTAVVRSMGDAVVKVPDKRVNRFALA